MNSRVLGLLCMIGGLAYFIGGLGAQMSAPPTSAEPFQADALTGVLSIMWGIGSFCGALGIFNLKVTGTHPVARGLTAIPLVTTALNTLSFLILLVGSRPPMPMIFIGLLGGLGSMTIVGVLALLARQWVSWRKFTPFLYLVALGVGILSGTIFNIFVGLAWLAIGYAVYSSERTPEHNAPALAA